jgi:two-component system response regulator YesN
LADVAAALGIPRQRVCDIMKTAHGVTFVNYLNNYRVEQAQKMLGESDLPLERIGASTGFSSPSYFIRVFKDFTGLTPGEYRKLIRNGGGQNETHPGV